MRGSASAGACLRGLERRAPAPHSCGRSWPRQSCREAGLPRPALSGCDIGTAFWLPSLRRGGAGGGVAPSYTRSRARVAKRAALAIGNERPVVVAVVQGQLEDTVCLVIADDTIRRDAADAAVALAARADDKLPDAV